MFQEENKAFNLNGKFVLIISIILLFCFFVLSLFFLQADPDDLLSLYSRDAFTDEGLNTVQAVNWYKFGKLDYYSCDNFVKNPLYNCWIYLSYFFSDSYNIVGRFFLLSTLIIVILFGLIVLKKHRLFIGLAILFSLFNYYLFQYAHFTMPELLASVFLFCLILNVSRYLESKKIQYLVYAIVFTFLSFLFKFQFAYAFPLLFLLLFINLKQFDKKAWLYIVGVNLLFGLIYLFIWYFPHIDFFKLIYKDQIHGGFLNPMEQYYFVYEQIKNYFFNTQNGGLSLSLFLSIPIFIFNLKNLKNDIFLKSLSIGLFCWLIIESHKLLIVYLPPRYLVSTFLAISIFVAFQCYLSVRLSKKLTYYFVLPICLCMLVMNSFSIVYLLKNRKYSIQALNEKFSHTHDAKGLIVGQWANTIAINSRLKALPFTYNSFENGDFLRIIKAKILVVEKNEKDVYYLKHANYFRQKTIKTDSIEVGTYHLYIHYLK